MTQLERDLTELREVISRLQRVKSVDVLSVLNNVRAKQGQCLDELGREAARDRGLL